MYFTVCYTYYIYIYKYEFDLLFLFLCLSKLFQYIIELTVNFKIKVVIKLLFFLYKQNY